MNDEVTTADEMESLFNDLSPTCITKEEHKLLIRSRAKWDQYEAACRDDDLVAMITLLCETLDLVDQCIKNTK